FKYTQFLPKDGLLSQDQLEAEEEERSQRSRRTSLVSLRREPPPHVLFQKSMWPSIHWIWGKREKCQMHWPFRWHLKGKLKYDVITQQGQSKDKVIYSKNTDLVPKEVMNADDPDLQRPDEETTREIREKTRVALRKSASQKVAAAMPVRAADKLASAQYIRYTPSQRGVAFNTGAKQRVIPMVEMQKDPMEPPRFKINKKIPLGPLSPPAPVMHSPSKKMTAKEQQEWKILPSISNWKNAWEAVEMYAQVEEKMAQKEKETHKEKLREMAPKARERRARIKTHVENEDGEAQERDEIRHKSEVIALDVPNPRTSNEVQYDQRLFGMDNGFAGGEDEIYNVYDQAWRGGKDMAQSIYRPSKNLDKDVIKTNRFVPDKEFSGSDCRQRGREGPVQFEEDPFGLDKFLEEAKQHGNSKRLSDSSCPKEHEREGKKRRKE
uniref:SNW domain-containing protein 1 n=1 Tax=Nannospalax galili TaxID=1026970 RepID=A0A8C6RQG6_NANGA